MKISRILVACLIASMGSAAFAAKFNLRMGHAVNATDGQHAAAMKLAELVKQRTNGDVEITIFPANQLGNDAAMINGVYAAAPLTSFQAAPPTSTALCPTQRPWNCLSYFAVLSMPIPFWTALLAPAF
ncbi:MAG: 2,3-diketo-L-gulonate-binding periplasmic protein YiaO precursor [Pseudomonadota bacterium]